MSKNLSVAEPRAHAVPKPLDKTLLTMEIDRTVSAIVTSGGGSEQDLLNSLFYMMRKIIGQPGGKPLTNRQLIINLYAILQQYVDRIP